MSHNFFACHITFFFGCLKRFWIHSFSLKLVLWNFSHNATQSNSLNSKQKSVGMIGIFHACLCFCELTLEWYFFALHVLGKWKGSNGLNILLHHMIFSRSAHVKLWLIKIALSRSSSLNISKILQISERTRLFSFSLKVWRRQRLFWLEISNAAYRKASSSNGDEVLSCVSWTSSVFTDQS